MYYVEHSKCKQDSIDHAINEAIDEVIDNAIDDAVVDTINDALHVHDLTQLLEKMECTQQKLNIKHKACYHWLLVKFYLQE